MKRIAITASALFLISASVSIVSLSQLHGPEQVVPSPLHLEDDVPYFAPGPDFKLSKEATAQKAFDAEQRQKALGPN